MTTLKISDLSVGDWVKIDIYPTPHKVQDLAFNGYVWLSERNRVAPIDIIAPIPITAEILRKNGFIEDEQYPWRKTWEHITLCNNILRTCRISYENGDWFVTAMLEDTRKPKEELRDISYARASYKKELFVHQIQHALRLAGVDKEINL